MPKSTSILAVCILASSSAALLAQTPVPAAPATGPAAVATPATAAVNPLAADNLDGLREHVSQVVDVRGVPTATGHSKAGTVVYLNFGRAHQAISAVAFLGGGATGGDPATHKVQSEDDLKSFVGKPVIVHGKLTDYKGDLQITLDSLDQIKLAPQ